MNALYPEIKRLLNPHVYYVDGIKDYIELKERLIKEIR